MNDYTRHRAGMSHPNAVVARHELERQERHRLYRLSQMGPNRRPGSATRGSSAPSVQFGRERDVPRLRSGSCSRPSSASRPRSAPSGLSISGQAVQSSASRGSLGRGGGQRGASASATMTRRHEMMLSPRARLEEAQSHLGLSTEEEERALREELKSWYFGEFPELVSDCASTSGVEAQSASPEPTPPRPVPDPPQTTQLRPTPETTPAQPVSHPGPCHAYSQPYGQQTSSTVTASPFAPFALGRAHAHAPFAAAAAAAGARSAGSWAPKRLKSGRPVSPSKRPPVRLLEAAAALQAKMAKGVFYGAHGDRDARLGGAASVVA